MRFISSFALATVMALSVVGCGGKKAPSVTPGPPVDKVLVAVQEAGDAVRAAQAAELAFYATGNSHITAAEQAEIDTAFEKTSDVVIAAVAAYQSAETAENKQALVQSIVSGIKDLAAVLGVPKTAAYAKWLDTAAVFINLAIAQAGS